MKLFAWGFRPRHAVMILAIVAILSVGLYLFVSQSDALEQAEFFARTSPEVAKRIGHVSEVRMRFWDGFNLNYSGSGGEASFLLAIKGQQESAVLDVRLSRVANVWRVEDAYISSSAEKGARILTDAKR